MTNANNELAHGTLASASLMSLMSSRVFSPSRNILLAALLPDDCGPILVYSLSCCLAKSTYMKDLGGAFHATMHCSSGAQHFCIRF
jgi:hypothetical protein